MRERREGGRQAEIDREGGVGEYKKRGDVRRKDINKNMEKDGGVRKRNRL